MSLPALDEFPHAAWTRLVARLAHALTHAQMAYGDPAGLVPLRVAIAQHLRASRRPMRGRAGDDRLGLSGGAPPGERRAGGAWRPGAVEEPGHPLARAALCATMADIVSVPVDGEGMSVASLRRHGSRVRAACVTPSHQYPLGMSMTASRRFALLDWAYRRSAWVASAAACEKPIERLGRRGLPTGFRVGESLRRRRVALQRWSLLFFPLFRNPFWQNLAQACA